MESMENDLILEKVKSIFIGLARDEFANFPNSIEKVDKCHTGFGFSHPNLECGCYDLLKTHNEMDSYFYLEYIGLV